MIVLLQVRHSPQRLWCMLIQIFQSSTITHWSSLNDSRYSILLSNSASMLGFSLFSHRFLASLSALWMRRWVRFRLAEVGNGTDIQHSSIHQRLCIVLASSSGLVGFLKKKLNGIVSLDWYLKYATDPRSGQVLGDGLRSGQSSSLSFSISRLIIIWVWRKPSIINVIIELLDAE